MPKVALELQTINVYDHFWNTGITLNSEKLIYVWVYYMFLGAVAEENIALTGVLPMDLDRVVS